MQLSRLWSGLLLPFLNLKYANELAGPSFINSSVNLVESSSQLINTQSTVHRQRRPLVIWHGLGDNYNSSGIIRTQELVKQLHPGIFVYVVRLDENPSNDQQKSFFGDAPNEVAFVCNQIAQIPELTNGFDAIGFSQGGLFLRALVETCPEASVKNLITFGSPHLGIMDLPACEDENDWLCNKRNELLKSQIWRERIQRSVVPALYFRDPYQLDNYVFNSHFLVDINNERADGTNIQYRERFSKIDKLVLVTFTEDTTLVPKESATFQEVDPATGKIIPREQTNIYKQDLIGLKTLEEESKVTVLQIDDDHMRIPEQFLTQITNVYLGSDA